MKSELKIEYKLESEADNVAMKWMLAGLFDDENKNGRSSTSSKQTNLVRFWFVTFSNAVGGFQFSENNLQKFRCERFVIKIQKASIEESN